MALPPPSPSSTALITGASSGIGAELARGLARRGHGVTLVARRTERLEQLAAELADRHGVRAEALSCDVGDAASRDALAAGVEERGLTVEVLVNNAGFGTYTPFHESERERQVEMVRVNVEAVVDMTARYLPGMVERRRGAVLTTASTSAYQPLPGNATYAATKAFVLSHVQAIHEEVKRQGVTVTALCPGPVKTEFQEVAQVESIENALPQFMWEPVEDVAEAAITGLERGKREVVPGAANVAMALASQVTPNALLMPIVAQASRRAFAQGDG